MKILLHLCILLYKDVMQFYRQVIEVCLILSLKFICNTCSCSVCWYHLQNKITLCLRTGKNYPIWHFMSIFTGVCAMFICCLSVYKQCGIDLLSLNVNILAVTSITELYLHLAPFPGQYSHIAGIFMTIWFQWCLLCQFNVIKIWTVNIISPISLWTMNTTNRMDCSVCQGILLTFQNEIPCAVD